MIRFFHERYHTAIIWPAVYNMKENANEGMGGCTESVCGKEGAGRNMQTPNRIFDEMVYQKGRF